MTETLSLTFLDEDGNEIEDATLTINDSEIGSTGSDAVSEFFEETSDGKIALKDGYDAVDLRDALLDNYRGIFEEDTEGRYSPTGALEAIELEGADIETLGTFDYAVAIDRAAEVAAPGTTEVLDVGEKQTHVIDNVDSNLELDFQGADDLGVYQIAVRLELTASVDVTFTDTVRWSDGGAAEPAWEAGIYWVSFATVDGGTSWDAFVGGEDLA